MTQSSAGIEALHYRAPMRWGLIVLLAPALTALFVLFIAPISLMVFYSFWSVDNDYQLNQAATLAQYRQALSEPIYMTTLLGSAWMALLTTLLCVALALPLAWFIARVVPERWRVLLIVGLILPGWVSILIRTYSMNLVLGESG